MSVFCILINSILLIKCPRYKSVKKYCFDDLGQVKKYCNFPAFGQVKTYRHFPDFKQVKKYYHFADFGQVT